MKTIIRKILKPIMIIIMIMMMAVNIFANDISLAAYNQYSGNLVVGFASMSCNLTTYSTSAAANLYRDTLYSNFSLNLSLSGSYYDSSLGRTVQISDVDSGVDENLHASISSTQYGDLLSVSSTYSATYLTNTSYSGYISLP